MEGLLLAHTPWTHQPLQKDKIQFLVLLLLLVEERGQNIMLRYHQLEHRHMEGLAAEGAMLGVAAVEAQVLQDNQQLVVLPSPSPLPLQMVFLDKEILVELDIMVTHTHLQNQEMVALDLHHQFLEYQPPMQAEAAAGGTQ
jgi:hypothetical protein